jgi:uncharacterized membrane protein YedE/YeeE
VGPDVLIVSGGLFGVGLVAGFFMHRSDFCLAGAFRDLFLFRSAHLIRPLVLAVTASAILFELARISGFLPYHPFPWFHPPAGVNILGGFIFGVGMVLTGGCVVGVLYKLGGGNLLAGVGLLGLVVGSGIYAEIHPYWSPIAKASRLHEKAFTLPQLAGTAPVWWVVVLSSVGLLFCVFWWRRGLWRRGHHADGYIPLWVTALVISVLSLLTLKLSGMPMGITTSYAKFAAILENTLFPGHVAGTEYFSALPLHYVLPGTSRELTGGGGPRFDVVALVQYPLIVGIILGAFCSALSLGEFKPHWRVPGRQVLMVFCGGIIMALGARMSPGCNVWHILGGLPVLTLQSMLFVAGLLPGAWLGSRLLQKILV